MDKIRGGSLRISRKFMTDCFSDFITGKRRFINKNLKLIGITRLNEDIPFLPHNYDFVFTADDLQIIPEGCNPSPGTLKIEEVKGRKNCYKLV